MQATLEPAAAESGGAVRPVTADLAYLRTGIVNVYFYGKPGAGDRSWVLIDAGMPGWTGTIARAAAERYGAARPAAIVLTHGHFDHVGGLPALAEAWDVPVYAHELELPYLTGRSSYPPPDPSVGGGMMAALSFLYPRGPIDLGGRVRRLPDDCTIPGMPGWRRVDTPGHSPGHVSLFREEDRTLIAGDAFVTVKQESASAVLAQRPEIHGPPMYYTTDWGHAESSVARLVKLQPEIAATGQGIPLKGPAMRAALEELLRDFRHRAMPADGRYVGHPAIANASGVVSVPPDHSNPWPRLGLAAAVGLGLGLGLGMMMRSRSDIS